MEYQKAPPRHLHVYTAALVVFGVLSLLSAVAMHLLAGIAADPTMFRFWRVIDLAFGIVLFVVAWLRAREAPLAPAATTVVSILLAVAFPLGTLVFGWWFLRIRPRERSTA